MDQGFDRLARCIRVGKKLILRVSITYIPFNQLHWVVGQLGNAINLFNCLALAKVVEKPPHSGLQALLKCVAGLPPQLAFYYRGVE